jgi:hypothetical protein
MYVAFPRSEYYDDSAPPAPFGKQRTYPDRSPRLGDPSGTSADGSRVHCHSIDELGTRLFPCGIAMTTP